VTAAAGPEAPAADPRAALDAYLMLVRDGAVLLGRRRNTRFASDQWLMPAGRVEPGESVLAAAIREAHEEIGLVLAPDALELVHVLHARWVGLPRVGFFFRVRRWDGEPINAEPDKCSTIAWHPLAALPADTVDYARAALADIAAGRPLGFWGW
jgi:8-oxo-dGTP pyrophosphatase MutT (NUDIX family)